MDAQTQTARLTTLQLRILNWLEKNRDAADGNIFCSGGECWWGENRTSQRTVNALLRLMLISDEDGYYVINGAGRRILNGLPPYRDRDGNYWETVAELFAADNAPSVSHGNAVLPPTGVSSPSQPPSPSPVSVVTEQPHDD